MPLKFPPPPAGAVEALKEALTALGIGPRSTLSPMPCYALPLANLDEGATPAGRASLGSWLCLLVEGDEFAQAIRLVAAADGSCRVAGRADSAPPGMSDALAVAARLPGEYEVRLLSLPPLPLTALWLVGVDGDRFVALAPAPSCVRPNEAYSTADFLDAVRGRGRR